MVKIGEKIYSHDKKFSATVLANASIESHDGLVASIHKISAAYLKKQANNGWKFWYVERNGKLISIDQLRQQYIKTYINSKEIKQTNKRLEFLSPEKNIK